MSKENSQKNFPKEGNEAIDQPLPRTVRRKMRATEDRGLPPDDELRKLAAAYLERQHKHWPEYVASWILPIATEQLLDQMVESFKERHRTGLVRKDETGLSGHGVTIPLGGYYGRYSCDNSSPTSILDQMANALDKAKGEHRFIPWCFVFSDYSISGLDSCRQGYTSYKAVLGGEREYSTCGYGTRAGAG